MLDSPTGMWVSALLAGCAAGYLLMRLILLVGGGVRALSAARWVGVLVVLICFGIAASDLREMTVHPAGESLGLFWYLVLAIRAGAFGLGVLMPTLLVRGKSPPPNADASDR